MDETTRQRHADNRAALLAGREALLDGWLREDEATARWRAEELARHDQGLRDFDAAVGLVDAPPVVESVVVPNVPAAEEAPIPAPEIVVEPEPVAAEPAAEPPSEAPAPDTEPGIAPAV